MSLVNRHMLKKLTSNLVGSSVSYLNPLESPFQHFWIDDGVICTKIKCSNETVMNGDKRKKKPPVPLSLFRLSGYQLPDSRIHIKKKKEFQLYFHCFTVHFKNQQHSNFPQYKIKLLFT